MTDNKTISFVAVLRPNRSLTPRSFKILMALVMLVSFVAGIVFMRMGAWPVFGFFGLDVLLLYWAFKVNFADSETFEQVEVTDKELVIQQFHTKHASREFRFIKHWVRLELIEDKTRELVGSLTIHSHGERLEIASFLGPDERKEFYSALNNALTGIDFSR